MDDIHWEEADERTYDFMTSEDAELFDPFGILLIKQVHLNPVLLYIRIFNKFIAVFYNLS